MPSPINSPYKSKEKLEELYWKKGMNTYEIAKKAGVHHATVSKWMKKFGVERRTPREARIKSGVNPNLDESPDLAYILGVLLSDGWAGEYRIILRQAREKFADSFRKALEKTGMNPCSYVDEKKGSRLNQIVVEANSVEFCDWFRSKSFNQIKSIAKKSEKHAKEFIRGVYESEGTITRNKLSIYNSNAKIVKIVEEVLHFLGFKTGTSITRGSEYKISILGGWEERERFIEEINPCIKSEKYRRPYEKWTKEKVVERLQQKTRQLGHSPSQSEVSGSLVGGARRCFESWNEAKEVAGLQTYGCEING